MLTAMRHRLKDVQTNSKTCIVHLTRAAHLVWESAPGWAAANSAILVAQGLLPLFGLYLMKLVIDTAAASLAHPADGVYFGKLLWLLGLSSIVALAGVACSTVSSLVSEAQAQKVADHMYDRLHAKSTEVDLAYYENPDYYDTLHRAQREAAFRPQQIVQNLLQLGQQSLTLVAILGLLVSLHWSVVIVLFLAALPSVVVRLRYADTLYAWQHQRTSRERQAWYLNWILTHDTHAKEIRLFNLGELLIRRFRELRSQLRQEKLGIVSRRTRAELVTQASGLLAVFGIMVLIAYRTVHGVLTLGDFVMYAQAVQRGQTALGQLLGSFTRLYESRLFITNLYTFLDLKPQLTSSGCAAPMPRTVRHGLVLDHVSFRYPHDNRTVLEDVCLTIRPGEHVAFVGVNGAGKTTLIKLLCRLYDPTSGRITLDGTGLHEFELTALRRKISVVFQDFVHYHFTAWENIWFGDAATPPDRQRIVAAAQDADLDTVVRQLPNGYDTILGKMFDNGTELSLGQWQKVALARAFLRDAEIIILDEPTSSMDAQAEYEVFQTFRRLAKERTAIYISHRLSTVKTADRIFVLDGGRIVDSGTHDDLMQRSGIYSRLFTTQARSYR